jgi:hypothetical protein
LNPEPGTNQFRQYPIKSYAKKHKKFFTVPAKAVVERVSKE